MEVENSKKKLDWCKSDFINLSLLLNKNKRTNHTMVNPKKFTSDIMVDPKNIK